MNSVLISILLVFWILTSANSIRDRQHEIFQFKDYDNIVRRYRTHDQSINHANYANSYPKARADVTEHEEDWILIVSSRICQC
jgi:hypothetical protein